MKIVLFDPSLKDNKGHFSDNLGDVIIYEFVESTLKELFPRLPLYRIATHTFPSANIRQNIQPEDLCFLGGSNILNSTVNVYNNWKFDPSFFKTLSTKRLNVVTLGVGWGEYQSAPGFYSRRFYSRRLDSTKIHSVRDSYSASQLQKISGMKVINTGCPTTWKLDQASINRIEAKAIDTCIFTLTDYSQDREKDEALIEKLLAHFEKLVYFPQGSKDLDYLDSLPIYIKNKNKFTVLPHSLDAFKSSLQKDKIIYVGTRLHAGILALNHGVESLIISIDNRAREMAKDIHLPVIGRGETGLISRWLRAEQIFPHEIVKVPLEQINAWKKQFIR